VVFARLSLAIVRRTRVEWVHSLEWLGSAENGEMNVATVYNWFMHVRLSLVCYSQFLHSYVCMYTIAHGTRHCDLLYSSVLGHCEHDELVGTLPSVSALCF